LVHRGKLDRRLMQNFLDREFNGSAHVAIDPQAKCIHID
jgi:hypothetical protein